MNKLYRISGLLLAFTLFAPALALAQVSITGSSTVDAQIQSLLGEITSLQQQIKSLVQSVAPSSTLQFWNASSTPAAWGNASSTPPTPPAQGQGIGGCGGFERDLSQGSQGSDVLQLQQMLSGDGFLSASSTGFFGPLTARALAAFQIHFGIAASSSASGFFGPLTRNFLSAHCGSGTGTSTPAMHPMIPAGTISTSTPFWGGPGPVIITASSTWHGQVGSSTPPMPPCPQRDQNSDQGAAAALFVPHVILPMRLLDPCNASTTTAQ